MAPRFIALVVSLVLVSGCFAQESDLAVLDERSAFNIEAERLNGDVFITYSSKIPMDLELQFLTRRGEIIWSEKMYEFAGSEAEKMEYDLPPGPYIIRAYHGYSETIKRVDL
jgi:hypothetical protein